MYFLVLTHNLKILLQHLHQILRPKNEKQDQQKGVYNQIQHHEDHSLQNRPLKHALGQHERLNARRLLREEMIQEEVVVKVEEILLVAVVVDKFRGVKKIYPPKSP